MFREDSDFVAEFQGSPTEPLPSVTVGPRGSWATSFLTARTWLGERLKHRLAASAARESGRRTATSSRYGKRTSPRRYNKLGILSRPRRPNFLQGLTNMGQRPRRERHLFGVESVLPSCPLKQGLNVPREPSIPSRPWFQNSNPAADPIGEPDGSEPVHRDPVYGEFRPGRRRPVARESIPSGSSDDRNAAA